MIFANWSFTGWFPFSHYYGVIYIFFSSVWCVTIQWHMFVGWSHACRYVQGWWHLTGSCTSGWEVAVAPIVNYVCYFYCKCCSSVSTKHISAVGCMSSGCSDTVVHDTVAFFCATIEFNLTLPIVVSTRDETQSDVLYRPVSGLLSFPHHLSRRIYAWYWFYLSRC